MSEPDVQRYTLDAGTRVLVQVPEMDVERLLAAIVAVVPLAWGDYDQVAFTTSAGVQQFRSVGTGRNRATAGPERVPCTEVQIFVPLKGEELDPVLRAIYDAHPYEEPVIQLVEAIRSLHIRGLDEDNPNRFWNRSAADWVPAAHR